MMYACAYLCMYVCMYVHIHVQLHQEDGKWLAAAQLLVDGQSRLLERQAVASSFLSGAGFEVHRIFRL